MQKKVALVLSGCGYLDGSDINEVSSVLINLSGHESHIKIFAPSIKFSPTSHFKDDLLDSGTRNTLEEASRLANGKIQDLTELNPSLFDGLVIPGGYGVLKHLSTWIIDGHRCSVNKDLKRIMDLFFDQSKPILAISQGVNLVARVIGQRRSVTLTLGKDKKLSEKIISSGCDHVDCNADDFISDRESKVVSTPGHTGEENQHKVFLGIQKATKEFIEMA